MQRFNTLHLPYISFHYDVRQLSKNDSYIIECQQKGKEKELEYFPKSDRLLIRDQNKWYHGGLNLVYKILQLKNPNYGQESIYNFLSKS